MTYEQLGPSGLDYYPCRYGDSRMLFRGPKADLTGPYALYFGGTATYGKFVPRPYPALVESRTHLAAVNLGAVNAGPDLYLNDPDLLALADRAAATVIQIPGAPNLTNRYYSVHPRRNDRFVQASALLRTVFRDVDFTGFHFTRHMLQSLQDLSPDRFAILVTELQHAWLGRMTRLIEGVGGPVVLLWLSDGAIPDEADPVRPLAEQGDVLFVDRGMVETLRSHVVDVVEVVASAEARALGSEGLVFSQMEAAAAQSQLGVQAQIEAAEALSPVLSRIAPAGRSVILN